MEIENRRVHARVQVSCEARVSGPLGVETGTLRDISKGGAAILLTQKIGEIGDVVETFISFPSGAEIAFMAEVVRLVESPEGLTHGLRFSLVEPAMQETLLSLIETLLKSKGSPTRKHPRISHRVPIRCKHPADLKTVLENISIGGLAMIVPMPFVLFEDIQVSIPDLSGKELLLITGRVINQTPLAKTGTAHRVGLEFKDLNPAAKACLDELIRQILQIKK